jgi:hypothetical protein
LDSDCHLTTDSPRASCANLRDGGLFVCGGNELYYAAGPKAEVKVHDAQGVLVDYTAAAAEVVYDAARPYDLRSRLSNKAYVLELGKSEWREVGRMPEGRCGASAVTLLDGRIMVIGGRTASEPSTASVGPGPPGGAVTRPHRLPQ